MISAAVDPACPVFSNRVFFSAGGFLFFKFCFQVDSDVRADATRDGLVVKCDQGGLVVWTIWLGQVQSIIVLFGDYAWAVGAFEVECGRQVKRI